MQCKWGRGGGRGLGKTCPLWHATWDRKNENTSSKKRNASVPDKVKMKQALVSVGQCQDTPAQSLNFSENIVKHNNLKYHRQEACDRNHWIPSPCYC